jgi:putative ABC transport system permease protein
VNLLIGAATIGLILAPLALGVFLSYRVYHVLDLTADGAFGVGTAVVAALLVRNVPPAAATGAAAAAGVIAGGITGLLHTRLKVSALLAGVLTSTALYSAILFIMGSGTLSLASTESLLTWAARLGQRAFGLPGTVTLFGTEVPGARLTDLALITLLVGALAVGLTRFLRTEVGLAMRATGNSPHMAKAVGIEVDRMLVVGLGVSNGLIAFAGALFAQYQAFASIDMGIGAVVTGVATLMVGETLLGKRPLGRWIAGAVVGALVFRLLLALAVRAGLNPNALKLVTALFVLAVLVAPQLKRSGAHEAARGAPSRG